MVRTAKGETNKIRGGDGCGGVECDDHVTTGDEVEVEVAMVEDDETDGAVEAVEGPEHQRRPYEEIVSG